MPRKRQKTREKLQSFEDWELEFMKNGPPKDDKELRKHGFVYLDGREIWFRLQAEPDFNASDWPFGEFAFKNIENPKINPHVK